MPPLPIPIPCPPHPELNIKKTTSLVLTRSYNKTLTFTLLALIFLSNLTPAESKKPTKTNKNKSSKNRNEDLRRSTPDSIARFFTLMKYVYLLVFGPIIFYFFYTLYKDPAVPEILRALFKIGKRKTLGFLGKGEEVDLENKVR